jgi:transposase-like protein
LAALGGSWQPVRHADIAESISWLPLPAQVIQHAVWLYHCFSLSLRDVELILAARGIVVSYESIREWGLRFSRIFANMLKRRRPRPGDKWYMDEVFIRIRGKQHYLWRAVDQDGNVLDILVQSRRSATAARRFFRKLLKGLRYVPRVIVTDKLKSYAHDMQRSGAGLRSIAEPVVDTNAAASPSAPRAAGRTASRPAAAVPCAVLSVLSRTGSRSPSSISSIRPLNFF